MTEMSPVEAVFFAALEKATPAERAAYLDRACADNPDLRRAGQAPGIPRSPARSSPRPSRTP